MKVEKPSGRPLDGAVVVGVDESDEILSAYGLVQVTRRGADGILRKDEFLMLYTAAINSAQ